MSFIYFINNQPARLDYFRNATLWQMVVVDNHRAFFIRFAQTYYTPAGYITGGIAEIRTQNVQIKSLLW